MSGPLPFAVGLQAGFGASMAADVPAIASYGFTVVRQDLYAVDHAAVPALVAECVGMSVRPLFLVGGGSIARPDGSGRLEPSELAAMTTTVVQAADEAGLERYALEIGNEPDIAHPDYAEQPTEFAGAVALCTQAARDLGFAGPVISGGISNLNRRGLRYLTRMMAADVLPPDVTIGFHRYPESGRGPLAPHQGFRSREDEWETLQRIVAGRPVTCTEFGYHTADVLDDQGVAQATLWDLHFYEERGVPLAVVYQLNDGPGTSWMDRYGMRRTDGSWKPVAEAIRDTYGVLIPEPPPPPERMGSMYALTRDPIAEPTVLLGSVFTAFVDLGNGLVALQRADGSFVSQVPNAYGLFETRPAAGPYETFGGGPGLGIKTSWTRPHEVPPDQIFSYFCVQLPNV